MNTCTKHEIYDPKTNTCLKLNLKNKRVVRYVKKFLRHHTSFLNTFTEQDRFKFLKFFNKLEHSIKKKQEERERTVEWLHQQRQKISKQRNSKHALLLETEIKQKEHSPPLQPSLPQLPYSPCSHVYTYQNVDSIV